MGVYWNSVSDLEVMLQAVEQTTPLPANTVPRVGNFYSVQHLPGSRMAWPPLPGNVHQLPAWNLGNGFYLMDDLDVNYDELQAEANAAAAALPMMQMSMMAGSLASTYAYDNPVYLTNITANFAYDGRITAGFSIAGGTNFVPYDILLTTNLLTPVLQWNWLGIGYTSNNYTFYEQPTGMAFYILAKPSKTMTVGFGDDDSGQCDVPYGLTNALEVACGGVHSLALKNDGTVVAWGSGTFGQTNVPMNLVGVIMISAGWYHSVALLTNGMVTAWGYNNPFLGYNLTNVPSNLTNATVISAQALHTLALRNDGTLVVWGYDTGNNELTVPSGLSNVVAISAGCLHNLAVKSNGTVVAWGNNSAGQCDVPAGLSNVVDVAAGTYHSLALLENGTITAWGDDDNGETDVPAGLTNVVAIAASGDPFYPGFDMAYSMALKSDGTVVVWGYDEAVDPVGGLSNAIGIAAGADHALAVRTGPPTPVITLEPTNQYLLPGSSATFTVRGAGLYGVTYQWQTNGVNLSGATNATLSLTNVQVAQAVSYDVVVTDNAGMGSFVSSNASLNIVAPPVIISQTLPTNIFAFYQSNVTLSVTATAPGISNGFPLGYQWQFNGTNILGATSSNYTCLATNSGTYSIIVSNAVGSTNAAWHVTINYGTLAYYLSTNAVGYANGYSPTFSNMLELANWTSTTYSGTNLAFLTNAVWSTNCWLHGVQGLSATCIGYSNGLSGKFLITMVSPRHYLRADHVGAPGDLIAFLDTNNVIYWRTNVQQVRVGSSDTDVGILNADLPPSVGYLPVIPANFTNYLPTTSYVQGIGLHQDLRLFSQPMMLGNPLISWSSGVTPPFGLGTNWNIEVDPIL